MKPTTESAGKLLIKLLIFVFLLGATFVALPYATHQTYTESSSVWVGFPIAILDHGTPDIVCWDEYHNNVDLYKNKIISARTQEEYKLSDGFFTLMSAPNNVLNLHVFDGDWHYWAKYSASNGIVKPISCRVMTPSVMFVSFTVALIGTPLIVRAYKRFLRRNSGREK